MQSSINIFQIDARNIRLILKLSAKK